MHTCTKNDVYPLQVTEQSESEVETPAADIEADPQPANDTTPVTLPFQQETTPISYSCAFDFNIVFSFFY